METVKVKEAGAVNVHDGGTKSVTVVDLMAVPTPKSTKTWIPVPHADVPLAIERLVKDRGWDFVDPDNKFDIVTTQNDIKMFGVTKIVIPGVAVDSEFQMAIGFRNSHNKSIALRIAIGVNVLVCSNMIISGDIQVRREHVMNINPLAVIGAAFDQIPDAATRLTRWFSDLRSIRLVEADGIAFLATAVEVGALPIANFMDARGSFIEAVRNESGTVLHGETVWAAYQSVTEQFKKHSLYQTQAYSTKLNALVDNKFGCVLN